MKALSQALCVLLVGVCLSCADETSDRVARLIVAFKAEEPPTIINLGQPHIAANTPSMKQCVEVGQAASDELWKAVRSRSNAKVVAMAASCLRQIKPKFDAALLKAELEFWKLAKDDGASLTRSELKFSILTSEGKVKKHGDAK